MTNKNSVNAFQLTCFVNVFGASPDFLLPVFTQAHCPGVFVQAIKSNRIVSFNKISDHVLKRASKTFVVPTKLFFSKGSTAIYAIEYFNQYFWGSCRGVISFCYKNDIIRADESFKESLFTFSKKNQEYSRFIKSISSLFESNYDQSFRLLPIKSSANSIPTSSSSIDYYKSFIDGLIEHFFDSTDLSTEVEIKPYRLPSSILSKMLYAESFASPTKLTSQEEQLFKAMLEKPAVVCLWNKRIIDAYVTESRYCHKIGLNTSFDSEITNCISKHHKRIIEQEIHAFQLRGYKPFYLTSQKATNGSEAYSAIIAKEYEKKQYYLKLYKRTNIESLAEFVSSLIKDQEYCNLCLIVKNDFLKHFHMNSKKLLSIQGEKDHIRFITIPNSFLNNQRLDIITFDHLKDNERVERSLIIEKKKE